MKKLLFFLVFGNFLITACKQNSGKENIGPDTGEYNPAPPEADSLLYDKNQLMVPSLPGVYVPPGLRKLNLVEMKKWGSSHNISKLEMVDHLGNPMPSDSFMITNRKLLMHMYANDSGRVVLAVVIEMSDALKKELLEGKW